MNPIIKRAIIVYNITINLSELIAFIKHNVWNIDCAVD